MLLKSAAFDSGPMKWQGSRRFHTAFCPKRTPLADPALGAKQICPNCQAKFYDLNKRPAHCPKCDTEFDPEEAVKTRRIRARSVAPDYDTDDELEAKPSTVTDDEDAEEDVSAPEIDEAIDDPVVTDDEEVDADAGGTPPGEGIGEIDVDEDLADDEDDDVPFLENEDDDSFEEEIEGLPDEGEEDR